MKILFLAAQAEAASVFYVNAGKVRVHPSVCTKQSQSAYLVPVLLLWYQV